METETVQVNAARLQASEARLRASEAMLQVKAETAPVIRHNRHGEQLANVSFRVPVSEWNVWQGYIRSKAISLTQLIRSSIEEYLERRKA